MKQIEITVKVIDSLEEALGKLELHGFIKIRESRVEDIYMSQLYNEVKEENIQYILSNSVLLRTLKLNGEEIKKITYKNKVYDNGNVISEEKINLDCNDLDKAKKLFECLKFRKIVTVAYDVVVMAKGEMEFAFQNVENLGLLVEFENINEFDDKSIEEIKKEKERMMQILKSYGLQLGEDYDVKKAHELIKISL